MAEKKPKPKKDKRMLTLFFMITPSLLLAMTSAIEFYVRIFFQVVLIFFQIVIFKNFIDSYYGEDDDEHI